MQNDFLPNFILCNTTQRFVRSSRVPPVSVQKPSVPQAKPNFYCGTQDLNSAYQSFARLHSAFFGIPHIYSVVRLLGSRSLPWLIRALLDHLSNKITTLEPLITGLQEVLPKSIGLLPFDGGVSELIKFCENQKAAFNWQGSHHGMDRGNSRSTQFSVYSGKVCADKISRQLSPWASALFEFLPLFIRKQLLLRPESDEVKENNIDNE